MVSVHSVLFTRSKSTVRAEKGKTLVGQLNCVKGWLGKSGCWWGNSPLLYMVKTAMAESRSMPWKIQQTFVCWRKVHRRRYYSRHISWYSGIKIRVYWRKK